MSTIPDFTGHELEIIHEALAERYGTPVDVERAESELRLDPDTTVLTLCPTVYWKHDNCHFVVFKCGEQRYRCQFFYRANQQYGTGIKEFDNLGDCVITLLRVQADHESQRQGTFPGTRGT